MDGGGKLEEVQIHKETIRKRFEEKMNLIVDRPNPMRGGNFTNGNTARKAFNNIEIFSECLGFDEEGKLILHRVSIMLKALKSRTKLDPESYRIYGTETYKMFLNKFPWYKPSPYFHRLCIHVAEIAAHLPLPISYYSEEATEKRNKEIRQYREFHARKISRKENLLDILHRCWITSDYVISLKHLSCTKNRSEIPQEAQQLLTNKNNIFLDESDSEYDEEL